MGWHFGFKLHLIINDCGELLAFKLTPANVDDRKPVPDMTKDLIGKLFGDRGYVSQKFLNNTPTIIYETYPSLTI
ncbi:transposase [Nostoc punctiforme UO1]